MLKNLLSLVPEFEEYVEINNGKRVLYCKCEKSLYGSMDSGKLSYIKLSKLLHDNEFNPNPYEPCWYNKVVNGSQLSIIYHLDDLKCSHNNPEIVEEFVALIEAEYGKEAPCSVTRGKIHVYLGFTINYSIPGEVLFNMYELLQKMVN